MYSQEVHDIIEKLKERVTDQELSNDLNMLSLYSEMRSNALYDLDMRNKVQADKVKLLIDNLDSAEAALDNLEMDKKTLHRLFLRAAIEAQSGKRKSSSDDDED